MKKFTLFFFAALFAAVSFASNGKAKSAGLLPASSVTPGQLVRKVKTPQPRFLSNRAPRRAATGGAYVKVNSTPAEWEGTYLIVYEDGGVALNGGLSDKLDAVSNTVEVAISDGEIAANAALDAASFTVKAVSGGYAFLGAGGLYMGQTSDANGLLSSATTQYVNTLSIDGEGNANILSEGGAYLRFNATSGQTRFRYYKSSTYTNQKPVALYKLDGEKTEPLNGNLELVELPEGLETSNYLLTLSGYVVGDTDWEAESFSDEVQVGFDGNTVYIQGLSYWIPEAWVKGTLQDDKVLIPTTYMGEDDYGYETYLIPYVLNEAGDDVEDTEFLVLDYDAATGTLALNEDYIFAESDDAVATEGWFDYWEVLTLSPAYEGPATPATPSVVGFLDYDEEEGYGVVGVEVPITSIDGEALSASDLYYKLYVDESGTQSVYIFAADLYENLDADQTEIAFNFDDDWDFMHDGSTIYIALNSPTQTYTRFGVQSIYRGGGEEHASEISWYTIERDADGITALQGNAKASGKVYNLAGQRVERAAKGIYVVNGKKVVVK